MLGRPRIQLKTNAQLRAMRRAGLVVQAALAAVVRETQPGITTGELDAIAAEMIRSAGATSSFLGYGEGFGLPPFPGVTCTSVNDVVVHGIPGPQVLKAGDVISVDCGAIVDGWHGDSAVTIEVANVDESTHTLSEVTRAALWDGIAAGRVGGRLGDIEHAIGHAVRSAGDYGIAEGFTGHGIGTEMHMPPDVYNEGRRGRGTRIREGLVIAIEPMVTAGGSGTTVVDADEWTVRTGDGSMACHWEHTVAYTGAGVSVLTAADGGAAELAARGVPFVSFD